MFSRDPKGSAFGAAIAFVLAVGTTRGDLGDEFKVKREGPFEFARKPAVTRQGDRVTIAFETRAFCDVTVAIEDRTGRIVRHLVSGVLGSNAPGPLQKDSKKQVIVWDGKDDQGEYVKDLGQATVRVSLGLKARYERHFLWSPHRRFALQTPSFCAQPEGVYVCDGQMVDFVYLFDHHGNYVRTVYPFPPDKLDKVVGLRTRAFEQSGAMLPWKSGFLRSTLLTCGGNVRLRTSMEQLYHGAANQAMTVRNGRIALVHFSLNHLATDGSTGGLPLEGPETHLIAPYLDEVVAHRGQMPYFPRRVALSPDGRTLYLAGFNGPHSWAYPQTVWVRGVGRVDVEAGKKGDKMETFVGVLTHDPKAGGAEPGKFKSPCSVDVDPQGRVYVADQHNNRVDVFDPAGKHLKSIPVQRPAEVCINARNGDLYVFTWSMDDMSFWDRKEPDPTPKMTHFGPFEKTEVLGEYAFPSPEHFHPGGMRIRHGTQYRAMLNPWAPGDAGPDVWVVSGVGQSSIQILRPNKERKTLQVVKDFRGQAVKDGAAMHSLYRTAISANPKTGDLYVGSSVVEPASGRVRAVAYPQPVVMMNFDMEGLAYLSTGQTVARYEPLPAGQWREVPFDYGEDVEGRASALRTGGSPYHSGGLSVSPKGHVVVAVVYGNVASVIAENQVRGRDGPLPLLTPWKPALYVGRGGLLMVRVWDKYGKILYDDAVKGLGYTHNVFMDKDDCLYVASGAQREGYSDVNTGTLVKIRPNSKILSDESPLPLAKMPDRPGDTRLGAIGKAAWWEGAEWFYGGIGFNGKNDGGIHACHCAEFRITQDYYARTFVPETVHFTVGVLDSAGNVMLRIGQYGNIDDGVPLVADPRIPKPRPLGSDEVALFHPAYLAVHTDRRLFINDPGNDRIVSVKLDHHTSERVALKDVRDAGE